MKKITSWRLWFVVLGSLGAVGLTIYLGNLRAGDVPPAPSLSDRPATGLKSPSPSKDGAVLVGRADADPGVTPLVPTLGGKIVEIPAQEDKEVKKGDVLLKLDDREALINVKLAEAALKAAKAELDEARKGPALKQNKLTQQEDAIKVAQSQWSAAYDHDVFAKRQLEIKNISVEERRQAGHELEAKQTVVAMQEKILDQIKLQDPAFDIAKAEAKFASCEESLQKAKLALDHCSLRAPEDGRVLRVLVKLGEVISPQIRQAAIEFCPDRPSIIRAEVEQEFASRVKVGDKVLVFDDVAQSKPRKGVVKWLAGYYTPRRMVITDAMPIGSTVPYNDVSTLECKISLDEGETPFKINQKVRVQVEPSATRTASLNQ